MSNQARNQLGTPGVAKSFLRGAQIFQTMPDRFFQGGEKVCRGGFAPLPPVHGPVSSTFKVCPAHFSRGGKNFSS